MNMLSAAKVKLHGMKTAKWTTQDKITQYKALITLYTRDKKIIDQDKLVSRRKTQRELKDLSKLVHTERKKLDNALKGDKERLRTTLSENPDLKMCYGRLEPTAVIERLEQDTYHRRKKLDQLGYEKKVVSKKLLNLKLEQALLEDRLKYEVLREIKQEKEAQTMSGKVQDATLRKEAAWVIHNIYKEIIDIMKKDAIYFETILTTVKNDCYNQSRCFLGATKLGQLATEYLDDRRRDFQHLERVVLKDMGRRKIDLKVLTEQTDNATIALKKLLRRDSDVTTCHIDPKEFVQMNDVHAELQQAEDTLKFLKETTGVPAYCEIYPCLQEQRRQNIRLKCFLERCRKRKGILTKKRNHSRLMSDYLSNTQAEYMKDCNAKMCGLVLMVEQTDNENEALNNTLKNRLELAANIRIALRQLYQISLNIRTSSTSQGTVKMSASTKDLDDDEYIDGETMLVTLIDKFTPLMAAYFSNPAPENEYLTLFQQMVQNRKPEVEYDMNLSAISLVDESVAVNQCLTREEIKRQSAEIVAANSKNTDLIPMFTAPKKSKWLKKKK